MANGEPPPCAASRSPRPRRVGPLACGAVTGGLLVLGLALAVLYFSARGDTPPLTAEALRAASARWETHGPADYDLTLQVSGVRGGTVELRVRDGEPVHLLRDGRPAPRHTWDFWTVPGQLEAMERERTGDPQAMFGVPRREDIVQRAQFDPALGYPQRYERYVLGKDYEVGWEVVRFQTPP